MDSFQQQAFSFKMPTHEFNPNQKPMDGEEYLQSVAYERSKCPAIVVKPLNVNASQMESQSRVSSTVWDQYTEEEFEEKTPARMLPTTEWLHLQTHSFQKLHDRITSIRQSNKCDEHILTANSVPDDDNDSNLWLEYCTNTEPLLSVVLQINQRSLEKLIEMESMWFADDIEWYMNNRNWFPKWVYSSLACLRLPLEPSLLSALRKICKTCIRIRNQLSADSSIDCAFPLNLIICVVTRNFHQSDLVGKIL